MELIAPVITTLIYICVAALVIYLVIFVLQQVAGIQLPPKVVQILWIIFLLIAVLLIVRLLLGYPGSPLFRTTAWLALGTLGAA